MRSSHDLEHDLEQLGQRVAPGGSIADEVMRRIEGRGAAAHRVHPRRGLALMRSRTGSWLLTAAAAAILALVISRWPDASSNGMAWADVIRQIRTARSVHISGRMRLTDPPPGAPPEMSIDMYLKVPGMARQEFRFPGTEPRIAILKARTGLVLSPSRKLACRLPKTMTASADDASVAEFLAQFLPFTAGIAPEHVGTVEGVVGHERGRLVQASTEKRNGERLRKYVVEQGPAAGENTQNAGAEQVYYWFDVDNHLALITTEQEIDGALVETKTITVDLDAPLADELFSIDPPPGYRMVPDIAWSEQMSDEIRELAVQYYKSREAFRRYRLIAWEIEPDSSRPRCVARAAREGEEWRIDQARFEDEGYLAPTPATLLDGSFARAWEAASEVFLGATIMTYDGKVSKFRRRQLPGQAPQVDEWGAVDEMDAARLQRFLLANLAWPEWAGDNLAIVPDHGEQLTRFERLPDQADHPGLVGVRVTSRNEPGFPLTTYVHPRLCIYWIDPDKDHLCVRFELHRRRAKTWWNDPAWMPEEPEGNPEDRPAQLHEYDYVCEITEFGRTADGRRYPKAVSIEEACIADGKRYPLPTRNVRLQLDVTEPPSETFFDWPEANP